MQCSASPYDIFGIGFCNRCFVCKNLELCQRKYVISSGIVFCLKNCLYGFIFQIFDAGINLCGIDLHFVCSACVYRSCRKRLLCIRSVFHCFAIKLIGIGCIFIVLWQCQDDLTHLLFYAKTDFCEGFAASCCERFLLDGCCGCLIIVGNLCLVCRGIDFTFQRQSLLSGCSDIFQFYDFFRTIVNVDFRFCDRRPETAGCTIVLRIGKFHIQMGHRLGIFKFKCITIVKFCSLCRSGYTDQITRYVVQCILQ